MPRFRKNLKLGVAQSVIVEPRPGHATSFMLNFNWHEGARLFLVTHDGTVTADPEWSQSNLARLEIVDSRHLRVLGPSGYPPRTDGIKSYTLSSSESEVPFLNNLTLTGRYRDSQGRDYEFRSDGSATLQGQPSQFRIANDVFEEGDFVVFSGAGRIPGARHDAVPFRRVGDNLAWYDHNECECGGLRHGEPDYGKPLTTLHRISPVAGE